MTERGKERVALSFAIEDKGILPDRMIAQLAADGGILPSTEFQPDQIQPASLDLRLGEVAYRVRASFLPGSTTVAQRIDELKLHEFALTDGAVLETGCVYIVPLLERAEFSARISGIANPKSSTGRIDVFTRLITDRAAAFDRITPGYRGPLFAEISPRTFPVLVRKGSSLNQLRIRHGSPQFTDTQLRRLHAEHPLVDVEPNIEDGLALSIDLKGTSPGGRIGWRAKRHTGLIDVDRRDALNPADYWEAIPANAAGHLVLDPDEFYILVSREAVAIPPDHAAEMVPFNPLVGEFRVHYAGFFDPGFGYEAGKPPSAPIPAIPPRLARRGFPIGSPAIKKYRPGPDPRMKRPPRQPPSSMRGRRPRQRPTSRLCARPCGNSTVAP